MSEAAIASMTGFARAEGKTEGCAWTVELKSVNGRVFDLRCRLPAGFDVLEPVFRTTVGAALKRGSVTLTVAVSRTPAAAQLRINRDLVQQLGLLAQELQAQGFHGPLRADTVLAMRGVVEPVDDDSIEDREPLQAQLTDGVERALAELVAVRLAEGARLAAVLERQIDDIAGLVADADAIAGTQPDTLQRRLQNQIDELLGPDGNVPADRIAQEVALLVARGDVREELDRLRAHIEAARGLLKGGGAIGRRLDFLCQEFNREANTICSKSGDVALTRCGLGLKAIIEQFREQVQNIE